MLRSLLGRPAAVSAATVLLLAATPVPGSLDGPAAMVVKVEGAVTLTRGSSASAVAVGAGVEPGDRLSPVDGGSAVLVFRTGATRTVNEELTIPEPGGDEERDLFSRTVQVLAQAANTDARSRPNRQGMIRPLPGQPGLIAPVNQLSVRSVRPTFTWYSAPGATAYQIQLRIPGEPPIRLEAGPDTVWSWPDTREPLRRGATYHWTVAPAGSGRASPEARFLVLSEEDEVALGEELELLTSLGLAPDGDGLFLTAILFREWGLLYEASGALDRLERRGDPLGRDVLYLRGELLDGLGRLEEAGRTFERADGMTP